MTVSTTISSVVYRGNGSAISFAVPFKVLDEDHLRVRRRVYDTGVIDYTYVGTDYSFTGVGDDSGTLTLDGSALDDDYELVIERIVPNTQNLDIVNGGGFYPDTVEEQLDLMTMGIQQIGAMVERTPLAPVGETFSELPRASERAGKYPVFDALGDITTSAGTGSDAALRGDLALRTGPTLIGAGNAPGILTSLDDILQHVNAASYFGIATSGSNAGHQVQDIIDELSDIAGDKGAVLRLKPYTAYDWEMDPADEDYNEGIKMRPRVALDLQGARITRRCHSDIERGFILQSHAAIRNGRIDAVSEFESVLGSALGTQAGIHGCIGIGALYGSGGTVASPSEFEGAHNWVAENLTLTADKDLQIMISGSPHMIGAALIQGYGGVYGGTIRNIWCPASSKTYCAVAFDWAFLSTADFSTDPADFADNRVEWEAGRLRTTHPYGNTIDSVFAENFSRPNTSSVTAGTGSMLIRLSGCQGMMVSNCGAGRTTAAMVFLTAGDPAFEFADANVRMIGMDGSTILNVVGRESQHGYLGYFDSFGDNLYRAIADEGYDALSDPYIYAGLTVDGLRGFTDRDAQALHGIRTIQLWGAEIKNCAAFGFLNGLIADERTREIHVDSNKIMLSRESNIYIGHGVSPPQDCTITNNTLALAGRGGGNHAGIFHANADRTEIFDNVFGTEDAFDDSTVWNIRLDEGTGIRGGRNKHHSTGAAGVAESLFSSDDFGKIDEWSIGISLDDEFIATLYSGVSILPIHRLTDPDEVKRGRFRAERAALTGDKTPTAGDWRDGMVIEYRELDAGGWLGSACVTSGTVKAALVGVTGSIANGSNLLTVSSAVNLAVGNFITVAGVTGFKRITAINGTVVTLDSNADATVAGAAVAFSAPVFKRFGAIEA